jgi:hypothetical protein
VIAPATRRTLRRAQRADDHHRANARRWAALGGFRGAAAYRPQRRVIQLGPRPWRDYAGQLARRRGERGGEGAPGAYPMSSRGDG